MNDDRSQLTLTNAATGQSVTLPFHVLNTNNTSSTLGLVGGDAGRIDLTGPAVLLFRSSTRRYTNSRIAGTTKMQPRNSAKLVLLAVDPIHVHRLRALVVALVHHQGAARRIGTQRQVDLFKGRNERLGVRAAAELG